jgi:hypothetical protein
MIEVRIRHVEDAKAVRLCDWDPTQLDGVTRMLADHGVRTDDGEQFAALDSFTTEIVVEDGAAFFEVVLQAQD